jgi:hypothetical protein
MDECVAYAGPRGNLAYCDLRGALVGEESRGRSNGGLDYFRSTDRTCGLRLCVGPLRVVTH